MLCVCVRVCPGVEDEMALALELSRREAQPHQSSQKPQIQNESAGMSDRYRPSHNSAPAQRSFSAAPAYQYVDLVENEDEEEDEDLQLALAYSLSEMEAQQRAGATDSISGAAGRGRADRDKTAGYKKGEFANGNHLNLSNGHKKAAGGQDGGSQAKVGLGSRDSPNTKRIRPPASSSESLSAASTNLPSCYSEEKSQPEAKNPQGPSKKKKCGCVVC